ncbi:MAG: putative oxidoreductase [Ilumatobacteraceae bacterium]|nr:putative oxidoreductase [Ilumatobacteraceae bacterium]
MRPFRFGIQVRPDPARELGDIARSAEAAGFDVISTWDHLGDAWSPTLPLLAMANATERIRVCTMVLNNDFHHPVHLAMEYADLDHYTGGRAELGIGAGHSFTEYAAIGQPFDPPAVRKRRMAESVEILRRLLDGEEVSYAGEHYRIDAVRIRRSLQEHLPILVGVNGRAALAHAARHADTIGLTMMGRTLDDGQRHEVRWQADRLDSTAAHIHEQAGDRDVEINALVQVVAITTDRRAAAEGFCTEVPGLTLDDALTTPFLLLGTHDEIAAQIVEARRRWGISYFTVRSLDDFAPVIERLRAT